MIEWEIWCLGGSLRSIYGLGGAQAPQQFTI